MNGIAILQFKIPVRIIVFCSVTLLFLFSLSCVDLHAEGETAIGLMVANSAGTQLAVETGMSNPFGRLEARENHRIVIIDTRSGEVIHEIKITARIMDMHYGPGAHELSFILGNDFSDGNEDVYNHLIIYDLVAGRVIRTIESIQVVMYDLILWGFALSPESPYILIYGEAYGGESFPACVLYDLEVDSYLEAPRGFAFDGNPSGFSCASVHWSGRKLLIVGEHQLAIWSPGSAPQQVLPFAVDEVFALPGQQVFAFSRWQNGKKVPGIRNAFENHVFFDVPDCLQLHVAGLGIMAGHPHVSVYCNDRDHEFVTIYDAASNRAVYYRGAPFGDSNQFHSSGRFAWLQFNSRPELELLHFENGHYASVDARFDKILFHPVNEEAFLVVGNEIRVLNLNSLDQRVLFTI